MSVHALHERRDLRLGVRRFAVDGTERRKVGANAEVLFVLGCEDDGADAGVGAELPEDPGQLGHEVLGDRVVAFAMHDHARDRAVAPDVDELAHQAVKSGMPPATSITAPVM